MDLPILAHQVPIPSHHPPFHPSSSLSCPSDSPLAPLNPWICLLPFNTPTSSIPLFNSAKPSPSHFSPSLSYTHLNSRPLSLLRAQGSQEQTLNAEKANWKQDGWFINSDELYRYRALEALKCHLVSSQALAHNSVHSLHKMAYQDKENLKGLLH